MRIALILFCVLLFIGQASAIADYHSWDEQNQTATLYKNQQKWITVTNIGVVSDITEHRESLKVTSNYDYSFSALDDFYMGYEIYKGNNKITDLSTTWFLRTTENYNVTVDDCGIVSNWTSKEVFNNQTGINETVWYWDNQTIIIGNHTEPRSRINESIFNPTNKKIDAGQTLTFIKVTRKRAEVGEFFILLKPVFMGASIKELTWWNSSWEYKKPILINNTGNATVLTNYQVKLNVTYDSDMQADFDDIRVINDTSGAAVPYWIESKVNSSYANVWFNASSIPASVWTNSTYYLYYGNAAVSDGGSGNNTFILYTGLKTADYVSSLDISGAAGYIYEANVQGTNANIIDFGFGDSTVRNPANSVGIELYNQITYQYLIFAIKATVKTQQQLTTPVYVGGTPYNYKIVVPSSVLAKFYRNGVQMGSDIITNIPTANIGLFVYFDISPSGQLNWQFIRKYIAIEPTATLGTEEIPPTPPVQVQVIWWE